MTDNTEAKEFEYTGDTNAFHEEIAKLAEVDEAEEAPEKEEAAEGVTEEVVESEVTEETEEAEETEEDDESDEAEGLPKELLDKITEDPNLQKFIKNRVIRETKAELKETRSAWQQEREARLLTEQKLQAYEKAMEEFFNKGKTEGDEESEFIDPAAEKAIKELKGELAKKKEAESIDLARKALHQTGAAHASEFVKSTPDYGDAANYALSVKYREFKALGASDAEAANKADQWADLIAYTALEKGKNIAEYAYGLAKDMGYSPKAKVKKSSPNLDAIRENQKKTAPEKPTSVAGVAAGDDKLPINKRGEVIPEDFKKLLAKYL